LGRDNPPPRTALGGGFFSALPGGWVDYPNTFQNDVCVPLKWIEK